MDVKYIYKGLSQDVADTLQAALPDERTIGILSDFFGVFADNTRLRILWFLSQRELRVADLAALVGMQQSAVSHQLKTLRLQRLVKFRREGTTIHYSLDDEHVRHVFDVALEHIREGQLP